MAKEAEGESGSTASGLDGLQSSQQRVLLDAIDQLRNCGIDNQLSLPQVVVCGDQSAGKSSVLEALTEISFPRADNLCTRFATEIILRRAKSEKLSVKIIPDVDRPTTEQEKIKEFKSTTSNFTQITSQLGEIIDNAQKAMGIGEGSRTFARDVLSIEIEGPNRPQLTVVDLPGMIQNENQAGDKELVDGLIKQYINQPRAICLAIITAMNDADNQRVLTLVKKADPEGHRSLGIITKPDTLPPGSGNEKSFIELANNQNEKYFFNLGWHVVKNRKFEETQVSFNERNRLEDSFFRDSNFKDLPKNSVGIDALRQRLSDVLFDHVKRELPGIRSEVGKMLSAIRKRLENLGMSRVSADERREYLMQVSERMKDVCKCALSGNYESEFFRATNAIDFDQESTTSTRRLRAQIQQTNELFAERMRKDAHTLQFGREPSGKDEHKRFAKNDQLDVLKEDADEPIKISYDVALAWVRRMMTSNRGRELYGNYNPILISELFWFQSKSWHSVAKEHVDRVSSVASAFLHDLLDQICSTDVRDNIWTQCLEDGLNLKESEAYDFLKKIMRSYQDHPINHNHYYTDTVQKIRHQREKARFEKAMEIATSQKVINNQYVNVVDKDGALSALSAPTEASQLLFSCEEALDCMRSIYKVKQKVFIDIVLTHVAEEHIFHDLENIFSPKMVNRMTDDEVERLAAEPDGVKRERLHCQDQLVKLQRGQEILKGVTSKQ